MCCINTMNYYSARKRKEIMASAATWMDLEKHRYHTILLATQISYDIACTRDLKQ